MLPFRHTNLFSIKKKDVNTCVLNALIVGNSNCTLVQLRIEELIEDFLCRGRREEELKSCV